MAISNLIDDILRTLADQHRRYALYYLQEETEAEIDEIARYVAAWSAEKPADKVIDDELQPLLTEFRHNHLNRLRDTSCIEYNERTGVVRYKSPPKILEALLRVLAPIEDPEQN